MLTAGPEILVNTTVSGNQWFPTIARLQNGYYIAAWTDDSGLGGDNSSESVKAQLLDANGVKIGPEFLINQNTSGRQYDPKIAVLADGNFVVTWTDDTGDASSWAIKARLYSPSGSPLGNEFLVNTTTANGQWDADVLALPSGGFLVTWADQTGDSSLYGTRGQLFDAAGAKIGTEFLVNTTELSYQNGSTMAALESGGFVVTWNDFSHTGGDASRYSIRAQRYDDAGNRIGGEFLVNTTTANDQGVPCIAALAGGGYVITWMDNSFLGGDPSGWSIRGQVFTDAGVKVGAEFAVNTQTAGHQEFPVVIALPSGGFAIAWQDELGDGSGYAAKVRLFDASGAPVDGEQLLNSTTAGNQQHPFLIPNGDGFAAIWWDTSGTGGDASGAGIMLRFFSTEPPPVYNVINGTEGDDFIVGTADEDEINGLGGNDLILAESGDDLLFGGDGDDTLEGNRGVDTFDGGAGFDRVSLHEEDATQAVIADLRTQTISNDGFGNIESMVSIEALGGGTRFADTFYGDDNRNLLVGSTADTLYGFGGDDSFVVDGAPALLDGGSGQDSIDGFRQRRLVDSNGDGIAEEEFTSNGVHVDLSINQIVDDGFGGAGIIVGVEHVAGSAGADILIGDGNDNVLSGEEGDDLLDGRTGHDTLIGGGGIDTASYENAGGPVDLDLSAGLADEYAVDGTYLSTDTLNGIENVTGSSFDDALVGDHGSNEISGRGGGDLLLGLGGDDTVEGGDGNDGVFGDGGARYHGPSGNDVLLGGAGDDVLRGGDGTDSHDGGEGFDRVTFFDYAATQAAIASLLTQTIANDGYGNAETMVGIEALGGGTAFADQFTGDDNDNAINGGVGDTLLGNGGGDTLLLLGAPVLTDGGSGVDTAVFAADTIGTLVPDTTGDGLAELVFATGGVVVDLRFNAIHDDGYGNSGTIQNVENIVGSELDDQIFGDDNDNVLTGLGGSDTIFGFGGSDAIDGGDGDDFMRGEGNFLYNGPGGNDVFSGGDGDDYMNGAQGVDSYDGGAGLDRISFYNAAATQGAVASLITQTISNDGFGNSETMVSVEGLGGGTAFADHFTGDDNANDLFGGFGDTIIANGGDDRFQLEAAPALLDGGDGVDTIFAFPVELGMLVPDSDGDGLAELVLATQGVEIDLRFNAIVNDGFGNSGTIVNVENVTGSTFDDVIFGDGVSNVLNGGGGNDTIFGFGGDDTIDGGEGNDLLRGDGNPFYNGPSGNDTLIGGDGDDYMNGGAGTDSFDGGDGFDRISFYAYAATQGAVASLLTQTITNDGFGNAETMVSVEGLGSGTAFADHFTGDDNANDLFGSIGDTIIANGGDDHFQLEGAPALLDGGDGVDTLNTFVRFTIAPDSNGDGLAEDLETTNGVVVDLRFNAIVDDGFGNSGTIVNVENVGGSELDDEIFGDGNANVLNGYGGNDTLFGFGGDDTIDGGDGDDFLSGEGGAGYNGPSGNDTLIGGAGNDVLRTSAGIDSFDGGDGFDRVSFIALAATQGAIASLISQTIGNDGFGNAESMTSIEGLGTGTAFADHFTGDDNANEFLGGDGDTLIGNGGDDNFLVTGAALIDGGGGVDSVDFSSRERLIPDTNSDGLAEFEVTTLGVDVDLRFNAINDDGFGNSGTIVNVENLTGSGFDDALLGDHNANVLSGLGGNDFVFGFGGDDTIDGGEGNDLLRGDGNPFYNGPSGNDTLIGGAGDDYMNGGAGTDSFDGGDGFDRISFYAYAATQGAVANLITQTITNDGFGNAETMISVEALGGGTAFADHFTGDDNANLLIGSSGDTIIANGGDDSFQLDAAPLLVDGGDGIDTINLFLRDRLIPDADGDGFAEDDSATSGVIVDLRFNAIVDDGFGGSGTIVSIENVGGSELDDILFGDHNDNVLTGHGGADTIVGFGGDDTIDGGEGDDVLRGDGGAGFPGPFGNDTLIGGAGDDYMNGGGGTDSYDGGDGLDRISFYAYAATQGAVASLLTQTITNDGFGNAETMVSVEGLGGGTAFADHFTGDDNANNLFGGFGDTIIANGGDDRFQLEAAPALLDGGDGVDTIFAFPVELGMLVPDSDGDGLAELVLATQGVEIDLRFNAIVNDGFGNSGTIVNVENVGGSDLDDLLVGDDNNNVLSGFGGADTIVGWAGDDTLDGGDGDDFLLGDGQAGYTGPSGNDIFLGGAGNDVMRTSDGVDSFDGGDDFDRITFFALAATQGAVASLVTNTISNDGFGNVETMANIEALGGGTAFADHFTGNDDANELFGGPGDTLIANGGDDYLLLLGATALADGGAGIDTAEFAADTLGVLVPDSDGDGLAELVFATSGVDVDLRFNAINDDGFGNSGTIVNVENVTGSELDDAILGDQYANVLSGLGGNDLLFGFGGDDVIEGGEGHDALRGDGLGVNPGPAGNDILIGGGGHDYLNGGDGIDNYDGGDGFDRISFFASTATQGVVASLLTGIVSNDGFGNVETIVNVEALGGGTEFADTFIGDDNTNWLWGGSETGAVGDTLIGNGGDDLLQVFPGDHTLDGGSGIDTVSLLDNATGVTFAGASISLLLQGAAQDTRQGMMLLSGIENLSGTSFDDELTGDGNDNVLAGDEGADVLSGGAGNDTLLGDGRIHGVPSGPTSGPPTIFNEAPELFGPGHGDDLLEGGLGNDILIGGGGTDTASYEHAEGAVDLDLGAGLADEYDSAGTYLSTDSLSGIENAIGSEHDDALVGDANANLLRGLGGDDLLFGGGGDDAIEGGDGQDFLRGYDGNDVLEGQDGHDLLRGGNGDDVLDGGSGFDRASFFSTPGESPPATGVTVSLLLQGVAQDTGHGWDTLIGIEALNGTPFDDHLAGDNQSNWLFLIGGNDTGVGLGGDDLISLSDGNHVADGGDGIDTAGFAIGNTSGPVNVSLALQGAAQNTGVGAMILSGFENMSGSGFNDTLAGDAGENLLAGNAGNDTMNGGDGDDILYGDGAVDIAFEPGSGTSGPITIFEDLGGAGNDTLNGGKGEDVLVGGGGSDILTGGANLDVYRFGPDSGNDQITDFNRNGEVIEILGVAGVDDMSDLTLTLVGKHTIISWSDGDASILVLNVRPNQFTADNFDFGGVSSAMAPLTFELSSEPPGWATPSMDLA